MFKFTRNQIVAAYGIVAVALVGMLVLAVRSDVFRPAGSGVQIIEPGQAVMTPSPQSPITDEAPAAPRKIAVHVAGKVKTPGLYELEPGSRITDAIKAAGGAASDGDLESINLAEKLQDGQQVYIAPKGQVKPPAVSVVRGGSSAKSVKDPPKSGGSEAKTPEPQKLSTPGQGTVNINTAGLDELQRLPGIGPAYAQRIIDYRTEHGRFQSIEELDEVKGIGPKKLEKLRPFVTL